MTVTINKTDGTVLTTIADGAADITTTNIALIGRLYRNYGELINENLVKLLENFANTTSPTAPIEGQLWYDKSAEILKIYRDTGFVPLARITSSSAEPGNAKTADLWYDLTDEQLKLYNGSTWIVIAPGYTSSQTKTGAFAETIQDVTTANHIAVVIRQQNTPVVIISKDSEYTPLSAITGFSSIKKGINLSSISDFDLHGLADNAKLLDSLDSTQFLRSDEDDSTSANLTVGGNVIVGSGSSNLRLWMDSTTSKVVKQGTGNLQFLMGTDLAAVINTDEQVLFTDASAAVPSISFINDTDTGFYKPGANSIGVAIGGSNALTINSTGGTIAGNLSIAGNATVTTNLTVTGTSTLTGNVSLSNNLSVDGDITLGSNPNTSIVTMVADTLDIPNDLTFTTGDIIIEGGLTLETALDLVGNATITGDTTQTGNVSITGTFSVPVTDSNDFKIDSSARVLVNRASPPVGYDTEGDVSLGTNAGRDNAVYARNTAKHAATFNGTLAGLAVLGSHHVYTVTRSTTGTYAITLADDDNDATPLTSAYPTIIGSVNGAGYVGYNGTISAGDTSVTIYTYNSSGTLADFTRVSVAIFDGAN